MTGQVGNLQTLIEQALARGWSTERICREIGCRPIAVEAARALLERIHAEDAPVRLSTSCPPAPAPAPTSRPQPIQQDRLSSAAVAVHAEPASLADIAREEQACIYGRTVPEHHGRAVPRPAQETSWERARLNRAARKLRGDA